MDGTEVDGRDFMLMMWAPLREGFEAVIPAYNSELALLGNEWWDALSEKKRKSESRKIALARKMLARPKDPAAWQKRCILACEVARQSVIRTDTTPRDPFETMYDLAKFVGKGASPRPLFSTRISKLYQVAQAAVEGRAALCGYEAALLLDQDVPKYKRIRTIIDLWCEI